MSKIVSRTVIGDVLSEWYGTLVTSGIKHEDGSRLTVQKALYVKFLAPPNTVIQLNALLNPWQQVADTIVSEPVDDMSVEVTAEIRIAVPYTFNTSDTLTWDISGGLRGDASLYTGSFKLYADELPSGTVAIQVPGVPDSALSGSKQTITLTKGDISSSYSATPGQTTTFKVSEGQYMVKAGELVNADETVVAIASVSSTDIKVKVGETTPLTVTYGSAQNYSALDVTVGQLSPPLAREELRIQVAVVGGGERTVFHSANHTTRLRRLPATGTATIDFELTVNNTKYTSLQSVGLSNTLIKVAIGSDKIKSTPVDNSKFVALPINVTSDLGLTGESITLRLVATDLTAFVYAKEVAIASGTTTLGVPVAPGKYTVRAAGFIREGTVYASQVAENIVVEADGSSELHLCIKRGPHLLVRGFPNYLSFGALSDLVDLQGTDLKAARVTSVFKYAGNDGAGDAGFYLDDDPATTKTVQLAALVSRELGEQPVLPVMISYTVNLNLGDSETLLQNAKGLEHSFGNLILSLQLARKASTNDISAGFIVNPDFLGDNQQASRGPTYGMPVINPLCAALAYREITAAVPATITNTMAGYVQAVNWLIRTVAPEATFGWQVNLWGVGSSAWIYKHTTTSPSAYAKATADYVKSLGVYAGAYAPDFLAIDRYEADDFTQRAYDNSYCYGPREWRRFYEFVQTVAFELKTPIMPWQIPASRIPHVGEPVTPASLEHDQWGTGGTYIFGDPAIGSDVRNIHPAVLAIKLGALEPGALVEQNHWGSGGTYIFGDPAIGSDVHNIHSAILAIKPGTLKPGALVEQDIVESLFRSSEPFDLGRPAYPDFPFCGIFAVLLGGGSTTGVVTTIGTTGKWTQKEISKYMEAPISFTAITQKKEGNVLT
ncbi:putative hydroxymethyltransferase [Xylariaceae sp. AK1471]|nr:putative hydroxymethyltransferase [Xylariaceae sp. AK1471]